MKDDTISRQAAIDEIRRCRFVVDAIEKISKLPSAQPEKVCIAKITLSEEQVREAVEKAKSEIVQVFPSAQPERTCVNCGRTANNGGWYADGRTRCPIEEHYALPKDGYCHLWEKRNVTDDDYPERREENG